MIDRAIVADLVIEARRRVAARLDRQRNSLLDLADPHLVAEIEAALAGDDALSPRAEQFIADAKLWTLAGKVALALWDDLYRSIGTKRVGDLLRIEPHAAWLAHRLIEVLSPALSRPHVLRFIAAEMQLARGRRPRTKKRGSVPTSRRVRSARRRA